MDLAVLLPGRGVSGARLFSALNRECAGIAHDRFFSHNLPIPDCFTSLVERFLSTDASFAWFCEEDMVPPVGALRHLMDLHADVAAIDYVLRTPRARNRSVRYVRDQLISVSFGCTLMRRRVFAILARPWFRADQSVVYHHAGSTATWESSIAQRGPDYGGHDDTFCFRALAEGLTLAVAPGVLAGHFQLDVGQWTARRIGTAKEPQ